MCRKGQTSIEQLLITGISLTFIALLFYVSMTFVSDNIRITQANDAIMKLKNAADYVYSTGPGSKTTVLLIIPEGVQFINASGKRIDMRFSISSGESDAFVNTKANVNGTITTTGGAQTITVTLTNSSIVQFG